MAEVTDRDLLTEIAARLERGDAPDSKWPDPGGEYWALCPFHPDRHTGSFAVGPKGYKCFSCGASGGLRQLAERLGVAVLQRPREDKDPPSPPTLELYADAKGLAVDFLQGLGLQTITYNRKPSVKMPYFDTAGNEIAARFRVNMTGKDRFKWRRGDKAALYGLWRLADARAAGYVYLVEGESDCQTLWSYGLPALGVPGATNFQRAWAPYLDGLTVYAWQEPDGGGATFIERLGAALSDFSILRPPVGRKDVSEAHLLGDDVPALLERLRTEATTWGALQEERRQKLAAKAQGLAADLLGQPDILAPFSEAVRGLGLVGEEKIAKLLYLALTSRLTQTPISVVLKGPSSAGKSYTVETVLKMVPESGYLDFTAMSEHGLIYDERPIAHKHIVLYEASGLGQDRQGEPSVLAYCVRSLLSEGCIKYLTIEKGADGMQPRVIEREGPAAMITTTTWASLHGETETRLLALSMRDTTEQTRDILGALADQYNGHREGPPDLAPWHALQDWLELAGSKSVTIPYSRTLASMSNPRAVRLRRDFGKVLTLIATHAILHQATRTRDAQGRIVATLTDYAAVHALISDALDEGVEASVNPTIRETVEAVRALQTEHAGDGVSIRELAQRLGLDKSSTSRRWTVARDYGYLVNKEEKRGRPARLAVGEPMPDETPVLPSPAALAARLALEGEGGIYTPSETLQHCNTATPPDDDGPELEPWQLEIAADFGDEIGDEIAARGIL